MVALSINASMTFTSVLSPHIKRCSPNCHMSPTLTIGSTSSVYSSSMTSVGSISSGKSNPVISILKSMSTRSSNSDRTKSMSHSASSPSLLSANMYALRCASVNPSIKRHGTVSMPNFLTAITLPCPAMRL